jgi:hypothetical protein
LPSCGPQRVGERADRAIGPTHLRDGALDREPTGRRRHGQNVVGGMGCTSGDGSEGDEKKRACQGAIALRQMRESKFPWGEGKQ